MNQSTRNNKLRDVKTWLYGHLIYKVSMFIGFVFVSLFLSGCIAVGRPSDSDHAGKRLEKSLGYRPELVDTYVVKSPYKRFKKDYYYEFETREGMRFTYSSALTEQGMDGATFFYAYLDTTNYDYRFLPFYSETIEELCNEYGMRYIKNPYGGSNSSVQYDEFGNEKQFAADVVVIDGFGDIERVSELVYEILDKCRADIPQEGILSSKSANVQIVIKRFEEGDEYGENVAKFDLVPHDSEVSKADIYDTLFKNYIECVKNNKFENDVPDSILQNTNPNYLKGRFQGKIYDLWTATLVGEEDYDAGKGLSIDGGEPIETPEYSFTLYYQEPTYRED